jgi:hypothetical protein
MTWLAQQYPEEIAAIKIDEPRQWHSWGTGSHTGFSFETAKGVKTLVGRLRNGRMNFYGIFDGIHPSDTPFRPANERCAAAAESALMLLCAVLRPSLSRLKSSHSTSRVTDLPDLFIPSIR